LVKRPRFSNIFRAVHHEIERTDGYESGTRPSRRSFFRARHTINRENLFEFRKCCARPRKKREHSRPVSYCPVDKPKQTRLTFDIPHLP
jgi:hypothetical protein